MVQSLPLSHYSNNLSFSHTVLFVAPHTCLCLCTHILLLSTRESPTLDLSSIEQGREYSARHEAHVSKCQATCSAIYQMCGFFCSCLGSWVELLTDYLMSPKPYSAPAGPCCQHSLHLGIVRGYSAKPRCTPT